MTTRKPQLTAEEARNYAVRIARQIENGGKVWVTVPHTSRTNQSFTIHARLISDAGDAWLNYWYAYEMKTTLDSNDNVKWNGIGMNRGFEFVDNLKRILNSRYGLDVSDIAWGWF